MSQPPLCTPLSFPKLVNLDRKADQFEYFFVRQTGLSSALELGQCRTWAYGVEIGPSWSIMT